MSNAPHGSHSHLPTVNIAIANAIGRPRTVLDVRCGLGLNGAEARRAGAVVVGIENSSDAVSARRLLDEVFEVDWADAKAVRAALGNRKFDLILLADAAHHAEDLPAVLELYVGFLEEGGRIIVSFANRQAWTRRFHVEMGESATGDTPERLFSLEEATSLLRSAGLDVLYAEHNPVLLKATRTYVKEIYALAAQGDAGVRSAFTDLPVYKLYRAAVRPIEDVISKVAPTLLALDYVLVARRPSLKRPLTLTVGMLTMDEEESISPMIDQIREIAPDAQILLVDSSMKDQTPVIAERKGARVLRQLPPRGHGPAMELLMYEAAKQSDALIYLDCDFTYPANMIPAIRKLLEDGVDVVNASRTHKKPDAMPIPNYLANRTFAITAQVMHGTPASDLHSGMRGYRSSAIRAFAFDGTGDAIPIDTLLWPAKCGYRVVEIPIEYQERVGASKLRKMAGTIWTFIRLAKTLRVGSRRNGTYEVRDSD